VPSPFLPRCLQLQIPSAAHACAVGRSLNLIHDISWLFCRIVQAGAVRIKRASARHTRLCRAGRVASASAAAAAAAARWRQRCAATKPCCTVAHVNKRTANRTALLLPIRHCNNRRTLVERSFLPCLALHQLKASPWASRSSLYGLLSAVCRIVRLRRAAM